jgi:NCAIR mutase (PurE)-related protein
VNEQQIKALLDNVKTGQIDVDQAMQSLRHLPFEDLGFARVDHHRQLRCGFAEVIYSPGKTNPQIIEIFKLLAAKGNNVLATRAEQQTFTELKAATDFTGQLEYDKSAKTISLRQTPLPDSDDYIAVVTAGTADLPVATEAKITAEMMNQQTKLICDVGVAGIHRLLANPETIKTLQQANVVIVVAGMEGALASVVGGLVDCPVIAVPTSVGYGASFDGLAALLAMLNSCASGLTVVNIDNGFGAGYSASVINRKITQRNP